jgi:hypothetical protein
MTDLRALERLEPRFWRAPSAHNTQPWILAYEAARVELAYDPERALPVGDPTQRDLLLSLGAFVETVLVVAADAGIPVAFEPRFDPAGQGVGAFVVSAEPYSTRFAADDVARRQTSRLPYRRERLGADELADARGELAGDAELHELATRDLVELVEEADSHLYGSAEIVAELQAWLRLSRREPRYELDGLSYECLDLSRLEAAAVGLLLRPAPYRVARGLGLHRRFGASTASLLKHEGSALALAAAAHAPEDVLGHGRSLCRVWLALARHGVYTHPLSQILDCPATEQKLTSRLGTAPGRRVLSVFRAGRSEEPPRSHRLR